MVALSSAYVIICTLFPSRLIPTNALTFLFIVPDARLNIIEDRIIIPLPNTRLR